MFEVDYLYEAKGEGLRERVHRTAYSLRSIIFGVKPYEPQHIAIDPTIRAQMTDADIYLLDAYYQEYSGQYQLRMLSED